MGTWHGLVQLQMHLGIQWRLLLGHGRHTGTLSKSWGMGSSPRASLGLVLSVKKEKVKKKKKPYVEFKCTLKSDSPQPWSRGQL